MQLFTIRDIENLTGIKAHTLRIWEQRYQIMVGDREAGQHRSYSNEDLKHLLKISTLYHNGYKISKIAALSEQEINKLAIDTLIIKNPFDLYVTQLLEAAVDFDETRYEQVMDASIVQYGFEKAVFSILFPFLNKIGLLWSTGHVVPAMEHFGSSLIRKKIVVALNELPQASTEGKTLVLLFTPEHERHELPLLMMQYLLRKNNIRNVSLGQHVSMETVAEYCKVKPVTHLYTHVITFLQRYDFAEYVAALSSRFHHKQVIISGTITQTLQRNFLNVHVLRNDEEMAKWFVGL